MAVNGRPHATAGLPWRCNGGTAALREERRYDGPTAPRGAGTVATLTYAPAVSDFDLPGPGLPEPDRECFVMTPIGELGSDTRKRADRVLRHVIAPAIERLGLTPVRADQIAEPGAINRQILKHVLTARASIADLTDANPNVYYELAVRHSAGLPVVLVARQHTRLPFDLQQLRTIFFDETDLDSAATAREQIGRQLGHALSSPEQESPVLDVADAQLLHRSGAEQRRVAELVEMLQSLEATTRRHFQSLEVALRRLPANPERMHNVRAVLRAVRDAEANAQGLVETGASSEQMAEFARILQRAREVAEVALAQIRDDAAAPADGQH